MAVGFDDGMTVFKLGREQPAVSLDPSGKIIYSKNSEILTTTIKSSDASNLKDGDRLLLASKELGSTEIYPQSLIHSFNGRHVAIVSFCDTPSVILH